MSDIRLHGAGPNFRLTPPTGDELTADQELIVQAIDAGTYFVWAETPTGTINGSNTSFTLATAPNPAGSLRLYLNKVRLVVDQDYTLSTLTITMDEAPTTGSVLVASYTVDPT